MLLRKCVLKSKIESLAVRACICGRLLICLRQEAFLDRGEKLNTVMIQFTTPLYRLYGRRGCPRGHMTALPRLRHLFDGAKGNNVQKLQAFYRRGFVATLAIFFDSYHHKPLSTDMSY